MWSNWLRLFDTGGCNSVNLDAPWLVSRPISRSCVVSHSLGCNGEFGALVGTKYANTGR